MVKNTPMESGRVHEGAVHAGPGATLVGGQAVHDGHLVRGEKHAEEKRKEEDQERERDVGEVHRQRLEEEVGRTRTDETDGGHAAGAEAIGQVAEDGARNHEPDSEGNEGDTGPQWRLGEAVPVLGQPDALQPDDQHELDATAADGRQEPRQKSGGERPDAEQLQPDHRVGDPELDHDEQAQDGQAAEDPTEHFGVRPPHGVPAIGLNAVDDPGEQGDQADGEGDVAQPVDFRGDPDAVVPQLQIGPRGAEQPEGHRDQEDESPLDRGQDPPEDQADERTGDEGDAADPHRLAPLVLGKGIGEDGTRVGKQERATDALTHPHEDDPQRAL
jgi:hypothetical protein